MRPVNKGKSPYKEIAEYDEALPYLEGRIGLYCSYCEMPIFHVPEVEHIVSKTRGGDRTKWENLLLGCKYCNTRKSNKVTSENEMEYLWPDEYNTALAFSYEGGMPAVNESALRDLENGESYYGKADNLFDLLKLGNIPLPKDKDRRFQKRMEVYESAKSFLKDWKYAQEQSEECAELMKNAIVKYAVQAGFFSVWMEVFKEESDMRKVFIEAFKGTEKRYFDATGSIKNIMRIEAT